ncbi:MAG: ChrR family anti-sigma-E factor [Amaricoccus sp.]
MPIGHVSAEKLAAYADGSLSEGMCLIVAGHLTFCPACRARLARLESLGGALLCEADPTCCQAPDIGAVLPLLDNPCEAEPELDDADLAAALPCGLRARICTALARADWRQAAPGLQAIQLDGFGPEQVSLLRGEPGLRIPPHTHTGEEAMLVLSGSLLDRGRLFRRGQIACAGDADEHAPEVVGAEPCICLFVLQGTIVFTEPGRATG